MQATKPGEPMFVDKACLAKAADMLGLEVVETNVYQWYGEHVGDFPIPPGMKLQDLGKNAEFVLRIKEPLRSQLAKDRGTTPYDIGIVADPNNPGCYVPVYDYYCGGFGMSERVGSPIIGKGRVLEALVPKLTEYYNMVCDQAAALEVGDTFELLTLKDAAAKYPLGSRPDMPEFGFQPSNDTDTYVSIVDDSHRTQEVSQWG